MRWKQAWDYRENTCTGDEEEKKNTNSDFVKRELSSKILLHVIHMAGECELEVMILMISLSPIAPLVNADWELNPAHANIEYNDACIEPIYHQRSRRVV